MNAQTQKTHLGKPYRIDPKDKKCWIFKIPVDGVDTEYKTWHNDKSKRGTGIWKCPDAKCNLKVESSAKICPCCEKPQTKKKNVNPLNTMSEDQVRFISSLTKKMIDGEKPKKPTGSCPKDSAIADAVLTGNTEEAQKLASKIKAFRDWESFASITEAKMKKYTDVIQKVITPK